MSCESFGYRPSATTKYVFVDVHRERPRIVHEPAFAGRPEIAIRFVRFVFTPQPNHSIFDHECRMDGRIHRNRVRRNTECVRELRRQVLDRHRAAFGEPLDHRRNDTVIFVAAPLSEAKAILAEADEDGISVEYVPETPEGP